MQGEHNVTYCALVGLTQIHDNMHGTYNINKSDYSVADEVTNSPFLSDV
jgi:hypothetical protein